MKTLAALRRALKPGVTLKVVDHSRKERLLCRPVFCRPGDLAVRLHLRRLDPLILRPEPALTR